MAGSEGTEKFCDYCLSPLYVGGLLNSLWNCPPQFRLLHRLWKTPAFSIRLYCWIQRLCYCLRYTIFRLWILDLLSGSYQFRFHRYISGFIFGIPVIWNGCYLEYSHTLLVSASFTGFTHYLYTIGFLVYLESINFHSTFEYAPKTFYSLAGTK